MFRLMATLRPVKVVTRLPFRSTGIRFYSTQTNVLALIDAVKKADAKTIERMATAQPQLIIEQTNNDNSALHEAARLGNVAMIRALAKTFSKHFNVNHKCHCIKQRVPLAYAVEGGHEEAMDELFSLGGNPNILDERGWSVLDYAIRGIETNKEKFERMIIKIHERGGKANKFPDEAQKIILQIEQNKEKNRLVSLYEKDSRHSFTTFQEKYLKELSERKAISARKS